MSTITLKGALPDHTVLTKPEDKSHTDSRPENIFIKESFADKQEYRVNAVMKWPVKKQYVSQWHMTHSQLPKNLQPTAYLQFQLQYLQL